MKRVIQKGLWISTYFLLPFVAFAQRSPEYEFGGRTSPERQPETSLGVQLKNPLKETSLIGFFNTILDVLLVFAVPIIVFFIIYAGFQYVMAQGNSEKVTNANRALLYAVVGGVIILGAKVLLSVIGGTIDALSI